MATDKKYCMSAYLMYRGLLTDTKSFSSASKPFIACGSFPRTQVHNSEELYEHLKKEMERYTTGKKTALMLSGGIDSAILASFMPKGSTVYTLQCIVLGKQVMDETGAAGEIAERFGLKQKIVPVYWEDFLKYAPPLMLHKGAPIHSIEVQIYKAALQAREDGFEQLIFGENADIIYGGMNGLLSKDWTFGEFVERYSYVMPYRALKDPLLILEPFWKYTADGHVDAHAFINEYFRIEALGTYNNACQTAGIQFAGPFSTSHMAVPIDYERIRSGDTKYLVREVFHRIFTEKQMPPKTPMPRPMDEWMQSYAGPVRPEFIPHCTDGMSGDQKWMVYALEQYLNLLEEKVHGE